MRINSFFETLELHYKKKLPFVVYSRPINTTISYLLQDDDTLHVTTNFTESGFVFAPFNLEDDIVLFPKTCCKFQSIDPVAALHIENWSNHLQTDCNATIKTSHLDLVLKAILEIKNSAFQKVVLSRVIENELQKTSPIELFKRLYNNYKNAMVYCWYHPKIGLWLGATPELLFKTEGQQLTTIALAGTQQYNKASQIPWTTKEIDEQQIVVDYIVNKIKPYTKSVNVSEVETIKAGGLRHLKSRITSIIEHSTPLKAIIEALHPTPAVCGFPKEKAKDFILKNENYNREYYTGFLGELNLKQTKTRNTNKRNVENNAYKTVKTQSNFYVNLRCVQIKNEKALIYVGGGITKASDSEKEWEETVNKTKTISNILG